MHEHAWEIFLVLNLIRHRPELILTRYARHVHPEKIGPEKKKKGGGRQKQHLTDARRFRESQMPDHVLQQSQPPLTDGGSGIKMRTYSKLSGTAA
jgi:hypothetical protein